MTGRDDFSHGSRNAYFIRSFHKEAHNCLECLHVLFTETKDPNPVSSVLLYKKKCQSKHGMPNPAHEHISDELLIYCVYIVYLEIVSYQTTSSLEQNITSLYNFH